MSWTNSDGLTVLMHEEQGVAKTNGVTAVGIRKTLVWDIADATLLASAGAAPAANDAFIPANAVIVAAHIVVDAAFTTSASGALNIGLYNAAGTAIDADGIDAAVAVSVLAADDVVVADGILVGVANVGAANAYVDAWYSTGVFTAGSAKVVIEYIEVL